MKFDFWNNPLVVSALRVRYRNGGILRLSMIWLVMLALLGTGFHYYREEIASPRELGLPWHQFYFFILYGVQWLVSCATAAFSVTASMNAEVSNRTLDFQRITGLSPRQLLVGKLFGEPIQSYLLALASLPLVVWCVAMGVPGLTPLVFLLLYLNLFTSILLFSAAGMVVQVELKDGKLQGGATWFFVFIWVGLAIWSAWMGGASFFTTPGAATAAALPAPLPAFVGLAHGDAFAYPVTLFGLPLPCLLVTPLCQLAMVAVLFRVMERRLCWPVAPMVSKRTAYLLLAAVDVLAAGSLCDSGPLALETVHRLVAFSMIHLVASLILMSMVTPSWNALSSWVWRYRGRQPWWRDLFLGDRSPADLVGPTFCVLGGLSLGLLVLGPALMQNASANPPTVVQTAGIMWGLTSLLILLGNSLTQWLTFASRLEAGSAMMGAVVMVALTDAVLNGVGSYYEIDQLRQMSPSAHVGVWIGGGKPLNPWPLLLIGAGFVVLLGIVWHRRLRMLEAKVDAQLRQMGVSAATAEPALPSSDRGAR
jgi:hypothetical protein